jgi:hypothetical protein
MSSELIALNYHMNRLVEQVKTEPKSWLIHYERDKKYYETDETNIDAIVVVDYMRRNKYKDFSSAMFKLTEVKGYVFTTYILSAPYREPDTLGADTVLVYDKEAGIDHTDTAFSTAVEPSFTDAEMGRK